MKYCTKKTKFQKIFATFFSLVDDNYYITITYHLSTFFLSAMGKPSIKKNKDETIHHCDICTAEYSNAQGLSRHKALMHKWEGDSEMQTL